MNGFDQFNLNPELQRSLAALQFEQPTPVQQAVIPVLLEGREDLVALAQTGTGKTAAFGIPVLQRTDTSKKEIQTVILCPTRELCLQVCRDLKQFAKYLKGIRTVAIYGGASIENQLRALRNGVHIIVATPGRLHDMIRRKGADLSDTSCVVLDEADEMLSMGFEEDLSAIMDAIPNGVQKLLFSATMPKQVQRLCGDTMRNAHEITIGNRNAGAENVTHECYTIHEKDRYLALKRIVDAEPAIYGLIFCRTRAETHDTAAKLVKEGYNVDALHGDLSQSQRDRVMASFRDRTIRMLVATDVAARGIDVTDLTHVINYQLPDDLESYTHRSGRTGRAGKTGISVVLINMREKWKIKHIEKRLGKRFNFKPVPSGHNVCKAQLLEFMQRAKDARINEAQIAPFMPEIFRILDGLTREQLIQHFASLELNRFLDYYRHTPDIAIPVEQKDKRASRGSVSRRSGDNREISRNRNSKSFRRKSGSHATSNEGMRRPPFRKKKNQSPHNDGTMQSDRQASQAAPKRQKQKTIQSDHVPEDKKQTRNHKADRTPTWVRQMKQQRGSRSSK